MPLPHPSRNRTSPRIHPAGEGRETLGAKIIGCLLLASWQLECYKTQLDNGTVIEHHVSVRIVEESSLVLLRFIHRPIDRRVYDAVLYLVIEVHRNFRHESQIHADQIRYDIGDRQFAIRHDDGIGDIYALLQELDRIAVHLDVRGVPIVASGHGNDPVAITDAVEFLLKKIVPLGFRVLIMFWLTAFDP